ncbi:TetR/AcrR family transcriptional regulator [Streptomyces sp. WAC05374]|uniref:TetR/AcrR family transcriptional regulator n=1 Tax=Streptomyces sp. WAC05374 TaxID=2487420 RepID=UPI00190F3EDC
MEKVARRAGVGSATLHRHFPSRQALLEAVFKDGGGRLCARRPTICSPHPTRTRPCPPGFVPSSRTRWPSGDWGLP